MGREWYSGPGSGCNRHQIVKRLINHALGRPMDSDAAWRYLRAEGHGEISTGEPNTSDIPGDELWAERPEECAPEDWLAEFAIAGPRMKRFPGRWLVESTESSHHSVRRPAAIVASPPGTLDPANREQLGHRHYELIAPEPTRPRHDTRKLAAHSGTDWRQRLPPVWGAADEPEESLTVESPELLPHCHGNHAAHRSRPGIRED